MRVYMMLAVLPLVACGSDFGLGPTADDDEVEHGNADEHDWPEGTGWSDFDPDALPDVYLALTIKGDGGGYDVVYVDLRGQVAHRASIIAPQSGAEPIELFAAGPGQVAVQTTGVLDMGVDGQMRSPPADQIFLSGYQLQLVHPDEDEADLLLASNGQWTGVQSLRTGMTWPAGPFQTDHLASSMVPGDTDQLLLVASSQPCVGDQAPPLQAVPIGYRALAMPSWPSERWLPDEIPSEHGVAVWNMEAGIVDDRRTIAMLAYHGECTQEGLRDGQVVASMWFPESDRVWSQPVPLAKGALRHSPADGGSILVSTRSNDAAGWRLITQDWIVNGDQSPRVDLVPVGIIDADLGAFVLLEQTVDGSALAVYFKGKRVYRVKKLRFGLEKHDFRAYNAVFVPPL